MTADTVVDGDVGNSVYPKQSDRVHQNRISNRDEISQLPLSPANSQINVHDKEPSVLDPSNPHNIFSSTDVTNDLIPVKHIPPTRHKDNLLDPRLKTNEDLSFVGGVQLAPSKTSELAIDVADFRIPWSDLVIKKRIGAGTSAIKALLGVNHVVIFLCSGERISLSGALMTCVLNNFAGSFGTVHHAEWNGCVRYPFSYSLKPVKPIFFLFSRPLALFSILDIFFCFKFIILFVF